MQTRIKFTTVVVLIFVISCTPGKEASEAAKPANRIFDNADLLSQAQEDSIFRVIQKLEEDVGSQIAVLTIDSLRKEKLEAFSLRMARDLRIGRPTHNDGLLITIALADRQTRIEVGTGLENIVKDDIAARLIRNEMAPRFREEKYGLGIYATVEKLSTLIRDNEKLVGTDPLTK